MRCGRILATAALAVMAARPVLGREVAGSREIAKSADRLETTLSRPKAFGTEDYTVTVVPAIAFFPEEEGQAYFTSGSLGRFGPNNTVQNFYAPIDLPAGITIDYIGLNSTTDTPAALGVGLYSRFSSGSLFTVGELSSTIHGWQTDYNVDPIDIGTLAPLAFILRVQQGSHPTPQFFGMSKCGGGGTSTTQVRSRSMTCRAGTRSSTSSERSRRRGSPPAAATAISVRTVR
jgi:hypothetical protein